jgi:hypothetical protein
MAKDQIQLPFHLGRLYSEEHFLAELSRFGITRRGFRALLKLLCVPTLHLPGNRRFVDGLSFAVAIQAACRPGRKDFYFPGSAGKKKPKSSSYQLSAREYKECGTAILHEVVAGRLLSKGTVDAKVNKAIRAVLRRMALVTFSEIPYSKANQMYRKVLDERLKQFEAAVED